MHASSARNYEKRRPNDKLIARAHHCWQAEKYVPLKRENLYKLQCSC